MRKHSIKNTRINEEVLRRLSEIIRGSIKDPRINPMTSIVSVEVAPDLKTCKAYVSVLGDEQSQKDTLAAKRRGLYPAQPGTERKPAPYTADYVYYRPVDRIRCEYVASD